MKISPGYINSVFVLLTLCMTVSCTKFNETYRVTGTLYGDDEVTPLVGVEMQLKGRWRVFARPESEVISTAITDENGRFEFIHKHHRKATWVDIRAQGNTLIKGLGANISRHRDVCTKAVGYVHFDFDIRRELGMEDSIYLFSYEEETKTSVGENGRNIIVYPFDELEIFEKVKYNWDRSPGLEKTVRWGVGHQDFLKNGFDSVSPNGYPPNFNLFTLRGFPHVDTVKVIIK